MDVAYEWGVALSSAGRTQAGMGVDGADLNGDGWLEIHVTNFSRETNNLFMREAPGTYTEAVQGSSLGSSFDRLGFGPVFGDFDLDGVLDLSIANGHVDDLVEMNSRETGISYLQPPDLLINDGRGRFTPASLPGEAFAKSYVGRGLASADYDNDGDEDLYVVSGMLWQQGPTDQRNVLLQNGGQGKFVDVSIISGVDDPGIGRGGVYLDFDNDGYLDIYATNGIIGFSAEDGIPDGKPAHEPNILYRNCLLYTSDAADE